ncbi:MAG: hypothetical protein H7A51_17595 [Akkermansiaceae bacterium]|nr:hypothetical protein [Akkermansiaceae bacterium]
MKPIIPFAIGLGLLACTSCKDRNTPDRDSGEVGTMPFTHGSTAAVDAAHSALPNQILFHGESLPGGMSWTDSALSLDPGRYVWSYHSLKWDWKMGASVTFHRPIPWMDPKQARREHKLPFPVQNCFVVWVYNDTAVPDAALRFSFGTHGDDGDKEICHFPFHLNFTGWRTAWVSYDRDMQGKPSAPMDYLRIEAPTNIDYGTLRIGDILTHRFIDQRHQHGDYQVPFVRGADQLTHGHWDPIMHWFELGKNPPATEPLTEAQTAAFAKFRSLAEEKNPRPLDPKTLEAIEQQFAQYHIRKVGDAIFGDHIYMARQLVGAPEESTRRSAHSLNDYTTFLLKVGQTYRSLMPADRDSPGGQRIAEIGCLLVANMLEHGFAAGSSLGTMHHFGYNARNWVPAIDALQEPLEKANLLTPTREALEWFYNTRQIYAPAADWANMDYLNTLSKSDFTILCLGKDGAEKAARLSQYSKWLSNTISSPSPGTQGGFKPDGSLFHHHMHYHGYGIPAVKVVTESVVGPLDGTPFEITPAAYAQLKNAFMAARLWCYPHAGFNACGRHPITASGRSLKSPIHTLALSRPGSDEVDTDLASAYLRMFGGNSKRLFGKIIPAEELHTFLPMNYNASASYAYADNTVHLKGYGDGIRSHETYDDDNRYGRYLSHGTIQVFKNTLDHVSGHQQDGYDWCRLPGATTLRVPLDVLEGGTSFHGSTPGQKTHPSGAGSLEERFGAFLFQLDPTSDPQSLRVRKSVFAIDDTLICLGSGIANASEEFPCVTTLFQTAVPEENDLTQQGTHWYIDAYGTGYYLPSNQTAKFAVEEQLSRHNGTKEETTGTFSSAWIDHGTTPNNASYQYHILLNATPEKMATYKGESVHVIQQDDSAHIITVPHKQLEAAVTFAAFESQKPELLLQKTDRSCIVLLRKPDADTLKLSVTDINLPDVGTAPITPATTITLQGNWKIKQAGNVTTSHQDGQTTLTIPTQRSRTTQWVLKAKAH